MLRSKIKFRNNFVFTSKKFSKFVFHLEFAFKKGARNRASSARCEWPSKDIFVFCFFNIYEKRYKI